MCTELGIEQRFSSPMDPQMNGMIERFNRRIEDACAKLLFQFWSRA
ncbi:MAG: integrase core domain-containing protein [Arsenophonus sp. NEOnobi-MAG3]